VLTGPRPPGPVLRGLVPRCPAAGGRALRAVVPAAVSMLVMVITPSGDAPKSASARLGRQGHPAGTGVAAATGAGCSVGRAKRFPPPRPADTGRQGSRRPEPTPVIRTHSHSNTGSCHCPAHLLTSSKLPTGSDIPGA